jgi:hypothetical protein
MQHPGDIAQYSATPVSLMKEEPGGGCLLSSSELEMGKQKPITRFSVGLLGHPSSGHCSCNGRL